jgi:hypothetical protein
MMIKQGRHLTSEGLKAIINIRASMNRGLTPALKEAFPDYVSVSRPSPPSVGKVHAPTKEEGARPLVDIHKLLPIHPY